MEQEEVNLSAFQIKDRKERTIFVGNIPLICTQKQLKKHFKLECGEVEKVWIRSVNTNQDGKRPERAKIITKDYGQVKDNKNGYVLFASKDSIAAALKLNQSSLLDKHIRVDTLNKSLANGDKPAKTEDDFMTTVFVGNLPYIVSEEEVREHFTKFGKV